MDDAKIAWRIREQMAVFSGNVSQGLPKVSQRLVREVLYGVQARGSVRLSEIGRSLGEATSLKKIIERLGRQLERSGLRQQVRENLLTLAAPRVTAETLLVVDPTDLSKRYARSMEYLARVRDGSEGKMADGYWCLEVVAVQRGTAQVIPLYQELYSQEAPDFLSENQEILGAIEAVSQAAGGRGIWVMDRGGDREELLKPLLESGKAFLIRQRGDRHLIWRRKAQAVEAIATRCRRPYRQTIVKQTGEEEKIYNLRFGATPVRFPGVDRPLMLVVVEGFGQRPLMLLTTLPVRRSRKSVWRVVESYLARWRVEETIRFIKQSYQLEDIRLLLYERLRTMVTLVMAVAYFAAVHLGKQAKLAVFAQHLLRAAQRIYGVPEFRLYALADGIKQVLFSSRRGIGPPPPLPEPGILLLPLEA
ncbi:MAG: transposase [bacterium]|nr:transposase [bacterium]